MILPIKAQIVSSGDAVDYCPVDTDQCRIYYIN